MAQNDKDNDELNGSGADDDGQQFNLVDAIDGAYDRLDDEGNLAPETEKPDEPAEGAEGEKKPAEGKPGEVDDGGKPPDEKDGAEGEGEAKSGEPGEGEGEGKGEGGEGKEKPDKDLELSDEDRQQFGERATQRFEKLVDRVKTETQEKDQVIAERDDLQARHEALSGVLQQTNASPEQLSGILDLTGELMSGDPQRGQQAVQRAFDWVKDYARFYGVSLPQASLLDAYPDLQQQVDNGTLTQEIAEEHARLRSVQQSQQTVRDNQARSSATMQQYQQAAQQAQTQLTQLSQDWQTNDADFKTKAPLINEYAQQLAQRVLAGEVHPTDAIPMLKDRYDAITKTMQTVATTMRQNQNKNEPNPMRPGTSRSAGEKPKYDSIQDAVFGEYDRM